jgi:hypothetical protein
LNDMMLRPERQEREDVFFIIPGFFSQLQLQMQATVFSLFFGFFLLSIYLSWHLFFFSLSPSHFTLQYLDIW